MDRCTATVRQWRQLQPGSCPSLVLAVHCPPLPIVPTARSREICFASHTNVTLAAYDGLHALSMSRPLTPPPTSSQPAQRADFGRLRCRSSRAQISAMPCTLTAHAASARCCCLVNVHPFAQAPVLSASAGSAAVAAGGRRGGRADRLRNLSGGGRGRMSHHRSGICTLSVGLSAHWQMKRGAAEMTGSTDAAAAQSVCTFSLFLLHPRLLDCSDTVLSPSARAFSLNKE